MAKNKILKGKRYIPRFESFWDSNYPILKDADEPRDVELIIDDVKIVDLGKDCTETTMIHFTDFPDNSWEILTHFKLWKQTRRKH